MSKTFVEAMHIEENYTETENGALTYRSTLNANVDWFFHAAALRNSPSDDICKLFSLAMSEDPTSALRTLFYVRDIRGGQGERNVFRTCLSFIAEDLTYQKWLKNNLELIPEYGRWDDFEVLLTNNDMFETVSSFLLKQLNEDLDNLSNGKSVSLLGKWLPSEQASNKTKKKLAMTLAKQWKMSSKKYRQSLSALRKAIQIVETKLTDKAYGSIDYSKLPSNASSKYIKAFYRNDGERYSEYLEAVKNGEKKINASTLYPYDLVRKVFRKYPDMKEAVAIEALWEALPDYVPEINGLVVADTSGSMEWQGGLPLMVSLSLAVYVAERNKAEAWKNMVIPFSSTARFMEVKGKYLGRKVESIYTGDCTNTNLQSVFDLILETAIKHQVKKEDMPKFLLVVSDMEFDSVDCDNDCMWAYTRKTNFEAAKEKFQEAGYDLPVMVWWNVASRNIQTPVTVNDNGNILLSGCSAAMLPVALSGEYNPVDAMNKVINRERYERIVYSC